jgi:hypothetical protein
MVDLWSKCPIQKLWQIFKPIFMQNFTFSEVPKYSSYFYSLLVIYSIRKRIKNGKIVVGCFLYGRPSAAVPPSPISCVSGLLPFPTPSSLTDGNRMSVLSSPKSPSSARLCGNAGQITSDGLTTHHHPSVARIPMCAPAALSHHVDRGTPWCPITAAPLLCYRPLLLQPGCHARSSALKPRTIYPTRRANTVESVPRRPRRSPTGACA